MTTQRHALPGLLITTEEASPNGYIATVEHSRLAGEGATRLDAILDLRDQLDQADETGPYDRREVFWDHERDLRKHG